MFNIYERFTYFIIMYARESYTHIFVIYKIVYLFPHHINQDTHDGVLFKKRLTIISGLIIMTYSSLMAQAITERVSAN